MKSIKSAILALACCTTLGGCSLFGTGPASGGVVDKTDHNAPKKIESKEIVSFYTSFYYSDPYGEKSGECSYQISTGEDGKHLLTSKGAYEHELFVSDEEMMGIQQIIEKYNLVEKNGIDRITSGLAPECGPISMKAEYVSGEKLYFRENGSVVGTWTVELKEYFDSLMVNGGFDDILPPPEEYVVERFSVDFNVGNLMYSYYEVSNGNNGFVRSVYDLDAGKDIERVKVVLNSDLYVCLSNLISTKNLAKLHRPETVTFANKASKEGFANIYIDCSDGKQIYAEYTAETLPENWTEVRDALQNLFDTYIEEQK